MNWNQLQRICIAADCEDAMKLKYKDLENLLPLVNSQTLLGSTPLHFVALGSNTKLGTWLLQNGAIITCNEDGETPLHWACKSGHISMVKLFLSHMSSTEISTQDEEGLTALDWAIEYEHKHIATLLRSTNSQNGKKTKHALSLRKWLKALYNK